VRDATGEKLIRVGVGRRFRCFLLIAASPRRAVPGAPLRAGAGTGTRPIAGAPARAPDLLAALNPLLPVVPPPGTPRRRELSQGPNSSTTASPSAQRRFSLARTAAAGSDRESGVERG
jgi:hypothetical protein